MLPKTGILYFTTLFHGFDILRHCGPLCKDATHIINMVWLVKVESRIFATTGRPTIGNTIVLSIPLRYILGTIGKF